MMAHAKGAALPAYDPRQHARERRAAAVSDVRSPRLRPVLLLNPLPEWSEAIRTDPNKGSVE